MTVSTATAAAPAAAPASAPELRTEFAFELPCGVVDATGRVHRQGTMRMATARDEILPLRDPRVRDNEAYLTVLLLSRVVTRIGDLADITPATVEGLLAPDLAFLQDLYRSINTLRHTHATVTCPSCTQEFTVDLASDASGES
jgi:hypothetical protein